MVKRKAKSKTKSRSIQLKRNSRRSSRRKRYSYRRPAGIGDFLDRTISVRSLVKYSSITLSFVLVLAFVFVLGRMSVSTDNPASDSADTAHLSGATTQVVKETEVEEKETEEEEPEDDQEQIIDIDPDVVNLSDNESEEEETEEEEEQNEEENDCKLSTAGFDYNYKHVTLEVTNFNKEVRGENWASLSSLKLTVTNDEPCTIINPTQIKIKLNNKGKGSIWWDDEIFLPESFKNMKPGDTVSEIIPIHVSYADIYSEKDFRLTLFDDYDITIGTFKEYMTFS
ncbi:hypothetical protein KY349_00585 [Candidatus Woesearchaeota archaeon]|jgi:hypothetical protein|nr:hypothetical protein [Candidatus Woesearchaeota archaeon]